MAIFGSIWTKRETGEDMTRAATTTADDTRIDQLVIDLRASVRDVEAFNAVVEQIDDDASLSASDVIEISRRFVGGSRPKSRKAALVAIGQERLRKAHAEAKGARAAKSRTW